MTKDRLLVEESIRQIGNVNNKMMDEIRDEKQLIEKFSIEVENQRKINFQSNDDNLDLLAQSDALENHINMVFNQNKMIEAEVNKFIEDDDEIAR